jgi:hypothetical protein
MLSQPDFVPVARLDFLGPGSDRPGWYVRYTAGGRSVSERLDIQLGADAFGAIEVAAEHLGCSVEEIEFGGPVWPVPLDGLVPAEGTLEFVPDPESDEIDSGDWQGLSTPFEESVADARRSPRRLVKGLELDSPHKGRILNWSESGMGVEICRPLIIEARTLFKARGKRSVIELLGEVRWCHMVEGLPLFHEAGPRYRAGIVLIS